MKMKLWKLTKKQIVIRLILLAVFLIALYVLMCIRACPKWVDQVLIPPEAAAASEPAGGTQETAIAPPEGFVRIPAAEDSFLAFMRRQPVWQAGSSIMTYDGRAISSANAAAVYTLSLTDEDLQQCADTVIRFWSEYFYETKQYERLAYSYSSGYETCWTDWSKGFRYLTVPAAGWTFRLKMKGQDDSLQQMHNYLQAVMRYAGTLSLEAESHPIKPAEVHAGDILCKGGAPGHAVVIVDEAKNDEGKRCFLIAQGFIPSQSAHIIAGVHNSPLGQECPWYTEEQLSQNPVCLSSYTFEPDALRRWKEGFPNAADTE